VLNTLRRYGHAGANESRKVRRLNAGIKTDKLNAPKVQTMSSRALVCKITSMTLPDCAKISSRSRGLRTTKMNSRCRALKEEVVEQVAVEEDEAAGETITKAEAAAEDVGEAAAGAQTANENMLAQLIAGAQRSAS
jgi:hypothetical protein